LTQAFFAYRVKVISGKWAIAIVAWAGSLLRLAFGITSCVASIRAKSLSQFSTDWKWLIIGSTIVEMVVDLWNTAGLCYYLAPKRGDFSRTRSLINKIMLWAVETGVITCIGAILMLIFALALPHALLWVSIITFYPKLYSISLLVSLNGRQDLRKSADSMTYQSVLWTSRDQTASAPISVRKTIEVEMSPVHSQGARHTKTATHVQDDEDSYIAHTKNPPY